MPTPSNSLNISAVGLVKFDGTSTFTGVTVTNHDVLIGSTSNGITSVGPGSTGQILQSGGASADPTYSTATYPSTAGTSGKVLISDGTNIVSSTPTFPNASATSGKFIRSDGTNWIASTPTLPTSAGTSGKVLQSNGTNYVESTPTYPSTSGSSGKILISDGTNNVYSTPTYPNAASTALKHIKSDGTNFVTTTVTYPDASVSAGKVIISDGTNYIASTPTFPNASATTRKIIVSDGTNWVASTETWATPSTSGNILTSDGTNWTSAAPIVPSYSTGTWTPAWTRTSLSTTYLNQIGEYTKIGNIVNVQAFIATNVVSNAGSGNLTVNNLPFTSVNVSNASQALAVGQTNIAYPTSTTYIICDVQSQQTISRFFANVATTGAVSQAITLVNSSTMCFGGIYST